MEYETFNAASMSVTIHGQNIHPGSAKGKMKNAILIGLEFQSMLRRQKSPSIQKCMRASTISMGSPETWRRLY